MKKYVKPEMEIEIINDDIVMESQTETPVIEGPTNTTCPELQ